MRLRFPEWAIRTMKYMVMCALSGLLLLILGIGAVGLLVSIEMSRREAFYKETVLHTATNPDNHTTVSVIRKDYGKPCGDGIRVGIKFSDSYSTTVFSDGYSCDASIKWLNINEVRIESLLSNGKVSKNVTIDVTTIEHYFD